MFVKKFAFTVLSFSLLLGAVPALAQSSDDAPPAAAHFRPPQARIFLNTSMY